MVYIVRRISSQFLAVAIREEKKRYRLNGIGSPFWRSASVRSLRGLLSRIAKAGYSLFITRNNGICFARERRRNGANMETVTE